MNNTTTTTDKPLFPDYKPFEADQMACPYPTLAKAREEQPIFFSHELGMWVVTRYEDVIRICGEPIKYSSSKVLAPLHAKPAQIVKEFGERELPFEHSLVMSDPPKHTRLKQLVMPAFMPSRIALREKWVRALTNRLVDEFIELGEVDLVGQYAAKIPTAVIGHMLGMSEVDAPKLKKWVEDILLLSGEVNATEEQVIQAYRGAFEFEDCIRALVADRKKSPQDDLTSDLILAKTEDGSPSLSEIEAVHIVVNLAGAGADTTGMLIAQQVYLLLSHPEQWSALCQDQSLIPGAVDEALRHSGPVRGLVRQTTTQVQIGNQTIPENSMVFMSFASANRDGDVFPNSDQFDIRRSNANKHLALGSRAHACVGAALARLEARISIETLLDRIPNLRLAGDQQSLQYVPNLVIPIIKSLKVCW